MKIKYIFTVLFTSMNWICLAQHPVYFTHPNGGYYYIPYECSDPASNRLYWGAPSFAIHNISEDHYYLISGHQRPVIFDSLRFDPDPTYWHHPGVSYHYTGTDTTSLWPIEIYEEPNSNLVAGSSTWYSVWKFQSSYKDSVRISVVRPYYISGPENPILCNNPVSFDLLDAPSLRAHYSWKIREGSSVKASGAGTTASANNMTTGDCKVVFYATFDCGLHPDSIVKDFHFGSTVSISPQWEITCLNYEKIYFSNPTGICTPDSSKWFVNGVPFYGNNANGTLAFTFDDVNYYENEYISISCRIYFNGDSATSAPIEGSLSDCSQPLSASISGDEGVCRGDYGHWTSSVSGGSGEYIYEWFVNDELITSTQNLDYYFDPYIWWNQMNFHIDLWISDYVTWERYYGTSPFYGYLSDCESYKVDVYPNPADDLINVTVSEAKEPNIVSKEVINKKYDPFTDEVLLYTLINATGKPIYQIKTKEKTVRIPLSGYLQGIYHLLVTSPHGAIDKKIVIRH